MHTVLDHLRCRSAVGCVDADVHFLSRHFFAKFDDRNLGFVNELDSSGHAQVSELPDEFLQTMGDDSGTCLGQCDCDVDITRRKADSIFEGAVHADFGIGPQFCDNFLDICDHSSAHQILCLGGFDKIAEIGNLLMQCETRMTDIVDMGGPRWVESGKLWRRIREHVGIGGGVVGGAALWRFQSDWGRQFR